MKKAFTLLELILVIGVIIILGTAALAAGNTAQRYLIFSNEYNEVVLLVQRARNLALSREGQDETALSYGVRFNDSTSPNSAILFSTTNTAHFFEAAAQIETVTFPDGYVLGIMDGVAPKTSATVIYSPDTTANLFFDESSDSATNVTVQLTNADASRTRGFTINKVTGLPEKD